MRSLVYSVAAIAASAFVAACSNDAPLAPGSEPKAPTGLEARAARGPDLGNCQYLNAPAGSKLAFHVFARGVQIYRWTGTSWTPVGPSAVLTSDAAGKDTVGTHSVGPTWESTSGSKVVGTVIDRCTVDPNAVQWLSLSGKSSGSGVFNGVTFIQRVNTVAGKAPSTSGTSVGQETSVAYSAEYFFYR
jgi:hypothetical protein